MKKETNQDRQNAFITEALAAKSERNYQQAQVLLERAIEQGDAGALDKAYYNLALVFSEQSRANDAINSLKKALSINPRYEKALVNLGSLLMEKNDYHVAIGFFEKAIQLNPTGVYNRMNAAYSLNRLGRSLDALPLLQALANENKEGNKVVNELGTRGYWLFSEYGLALLQTGKPAEALKHLKTAYSFNNTDYQVCYNLAFCNDALGMFEEAHEYYDKAISINLNDFKAYQGKGCTFIHQKQFNKALPLLEKAQELNPTNFECYYNLACCYAELRQKDKLLQALSETIRLAPKAIGITKYIKQDANFSFFFNDPDFVKLIG